MLSVKAVRVMSGKVWRLMPCRFFFTVVLQALERSFFDKVEMGRFGGASGTGNAEG